jgi:hypothetical protein
LNIDFTEGEAPERRSRRKHRNHDSDTESDVSVGQASIELASSHSSDEDDEFDIGPSWEKQLPKNKKIGQSLLFKTNKKKKKDGKKRVLAVIFVTGTTFSPVKSKN